MSLSTEQREDQLRRQALVANMLGSGSTYQEAAVAAGMKFWTVAGWMKKPAFRAVVAQLKAKQVTANAEYAGRQVSASIDALVSVRDTTENESTRIEAASKIIDIALRLRHEADVHPRLIDLELTVSRIATDKGDDDDADDDEAA